MRAAMLDRELCAELQARQIAYSPCKTGNRVSHELVFDVIVRAAQELVDARVTIRPALVESRLIGARACIVCSGVRRELNTDESLHRGQCAEGYLVLVARCRIA